MQISSAIQGVYILHGIEVEVMDLGHLSWPCGELTVSRRFGLESEPVQPYHVWASTDYFFSTSMVLVQVICLFFTVRH